MSTSSPSSSTSATPVELYEEDMVVHLLFPVLDKLEEAAGDLERLGREAGRLLPVRGVRGRNAEAPDPPAPAHAPSRRTIPGRYRDRMCWRTDLARAVAPTT